MWTSSSIETQNSGAVWKLRWTSWAPVPNKPTVSVDIKQHFNLLKLPTTEMVSFSPTTSLPQTVPAYANHSYIIKTQRAISRSTHIQNWEKKIKLFCFLYVIIKKKKKYPVTLYINHSHQNLYGGVQLNGIYHHSLKVSEKSKKQSFCHSQLHTEYASALIRMQHSRKTLKFVCTFLTQVLTQCLNLGILD